MLSISPVSKDSTPLDKKIPCFILNYQPLMHFSTIFKLELYRLGIHVPQAFTKHVQIYSQMISQFFWHVALFFLQCRVISLLGQSTPTAHSTTQIWTAISRSSGKDWGDHHWSDDKLLLWNNSSWGFHPRVSCLLLNRCNCHLQWGSLSQHLEDCGLWICIPGRQREIHSRIEVV